MITIFTDGSARGNPGPGGWGAIVAYEKIKNEELRIKNEDWVTELGGGEAHTTNNRMELTSCIRALEFVIHNSKFVIPRITIYTDSEYLMKGMTEWVHNWQKKGWRTAAKKPVLNQDLWQKLIELVDEKDIIWDYVAGHAGIAANERCDEIATSFADGIHIELYNGEREGYKISLKV